MTPPRRIALAIATLTLAGLTTACGAVGTAVDCNKVNTDVTAIVTEFTTAMTGAAADPAALDKASVEAAGKVRKVAADYDGELRSALDDLATGLEGMKGAASDPSGLMAAANKLQSSATKIQSACTL